MRKRKMASNRRFNVVLRWLEVASPLMPSHISRGGHIGFTYDLKGLQLATPFRCRAQNEALLSASKIKSVHSQTHQRHGL